MNKCRSPDRHYVRIGKEKISSPRILNLDVSCCTFIAGREGSSNILLLSFRNVKKNHKIVIVIVIYVCCFIFLGF
jgi:hypothetical protein